jgi:hypothetical protein
MAKNRRAKCRKTDEACAHEKKKPDEKHPAKIL